jgi:hypothetical protein
VADDDASSRIPSAEELAASLANRVRQVLAAAEAARDPIDLPGARERRAEVTRLATRPHAVPDPPPAPPVPPVAAVPDPPDPDDAARARVREIADSLPRRPGTPPRRAPKAVPPDEPPDDVA